MLHGRCKLDQVSWSRFGDGLTSDGQLPTTASLGRTFQHNHRSTCLIFPVDFSHSALVPGRDISLPSCSFFVISPLLLTHLILPALYNLILTTPPSNFTINPTRRNHGQKLQSRSRFKLNYVDRQRQFLIHPASSTPQSRSHGAHVLAEAPDTPSHLSAIPGLLWRWPRIISAR